MRIDKGKLIAKIQTFISTSTKDLFAIRALEANEKGTQTKWEGERLAWVLRSIKSHKLTIDINRTWRSQAVSVKVEFDAEDVPAKLFNVPESKLSCTTDSQAIESRIKAAEEHLQLILMAHGDTVECNTKAILDSIQPYLKF